MGHPSEAHSFVLRIWLEDSPTGEDPARWRGRITNVLDDRSRVVQSFHHVEEFVKEYVQQWDEPPPDE
jgi:hypothetical protein